MERIFQVWFEKETGLLGMLLVFPSHTITPNEDRSVSIVSRSASIMNMNGRIGDNAMIVPSTVLGCKKQNVEYQNIVSFYSNWLVQVSTDIMQLKDLDIS